ncbi:unnamed protein product [Closterium sp. NIES-54]
MEKLMYKDWKAENEAKISVRLGDVKSSGLEHVELPLELSSGSTTTRQSSLVNGGEEAKDAEEEEKEVQQVSERAPTLPSRTTSAPRIRVTPQQRQGLHVPAAEEEGRGKRRIQAPNRLTYDALGKPARSALAGAALMVGDDEKKGIGDELKSIEENGTSELGYQQKEKVEYKELFAPVVKPTTLRTLLAGAAIKGWVVKQMDVTTTFLNGVLEEEIFMAQPEGFDDGSGRVLKLKKALYGLKQAPRQWYLKLRGVLEEIGFTPSTADHSLFMLGEGEQRSFMVVYVDDILIFSPSSDLVKEVMLKLQDKFKCKALGDVSFYLGLHIERDSENRCMRVHQRKYLEALAANFGQSEDHVATPFPSEFKCVKGPEEESVGEEERHRFHSLLGSLMYAAVNTRPDVAFATGQFEYMALFRAVREIVWQRRLLAELGEEQQGPTPLYCDSQGAIALAKNPVLHGLTKHMRVMWHRTRSMVAAGEVELHYVKTTRQPADMMTKRLVEQQHWKTSSCDESLFLKGEGEKLVLFLVYVDDILLINSSMKENQNVQQQLMENFKCKNLGEVKYYLRMHVERDPDHKWLKLHQEKFIKELGEKYGIENEHKVATPLPNIIQACEGSRG